MTTSIIILSYNTEELLKQCLSSLEKHVTQQTVEVIVVDNASTDDSAALVKKDFPKVKLIESKKNLGFAAGCNLGAKHAKGEYVMFLNSDIELTENTPEKLTRIFRQYEDAAIVGGMLQNKDGTLQRSYGAFYSLQGVFIMLFGGDKAEMKRFKDNAVRKVDWVSGGCMIVRKDLFDELGGFDEQFFMYVEDMELCFRAHLKGLSVYTDPSSSVTHVGQGSSDKSFAIVNIYKGLRYFYKKHKNTLQYTMLGVLLRGKAVICIILGIMTGRRGLITTYKKALRVL